jgi:hypothetical protein
VQGNGAKIQLSTGTTTSGNCAKFDANGNVVDNGAACGSGGGGSLTLTDGTHTVSGTTQITVTGGTVGGTTPNATLTVSGGGAGYTCPTGFTMSTTTGQCVWTQTAVSGTTSFLQFTGLTLNTYRLDCFGVIPAGATSTFGAQVGEGSTTWKSSSTAYTNSFFYNSNSIVTAQGGASQSAIAQMANPTNSGTVPLSFSADFENLQNTSLNKEIKWRAALSAGGVYYHESGTGYMNADTGAITAIRFGDASATTTFGGTCNLTALN